MDAAQILGIVAFLAIVGALALVLRGTSQLIAATRADEAFRRATADISGRAEQRLGAVLRATDDARYRSAAIADVEQVRATAAPDLAALLQEVRRLGAPADRVAERDAIVGDLEAAVAAVDALSAGAPDGEAAARIRIKRAYLRVAHATGSLTDHARTATTERPRPSGLRWELGTRRRPGPDDGAADRR